MRAMRCGCLCVLVVAGLAASGAVQAKNLLDTCHASSTYDVTITAGGVLFDRAQALPRRVYLHAGQLRVDGRSTALNAEDRDRITLIERTVRTLEPKVKAIATRAVDLAAQAVREQAAASAPEAAAGGALDARLDTVAANLKTRIAQSNSSHDWHGPAFQTWVNKTVASIVPLLARGLVQQAVAAALQGNLDAAAQLRQRAQNLATSLRTRIRQKLQVLRPRVQALCPSLRRIDQLESGLNARLPGNERINLVDVDTGK